MYDSLSDSHTHGHHYLSLIHISITLTTDDKTYTVKLGDYSTMDSQRYMDICLLYTS